eukprot:TRINITY_DN2262_c0_g1_i3.p1 TRINITY_DN2262_c0_g1~~TRINITY_DN2262_c0_g1_i3.p1  ORF type:complete len:329 (-),score=28.25 TRINITY_DN2262_c0_g1_i3:148-1134(-)
MADIAAGSACLESSRGIIGNYKIDYKTLGVGSNATVRLGYHVHTNERVAVKIVDISSPQSRERAYLEAEVLRKFKNENIIKLHSVQESGEYLYLFLEYVGGGDLATFIQRYGRLEESIARRYFCQIVNAVEHCHNTKVSHHDIKLENILISADRKSLRLIDFGLCTRIYEDRPITNFAGSPLFMSPEVFSLQPHTESVDIWSLGVCLYKMITDLFPFIADSYSVLEERVLFDDVVFPSNMGLSPSVKDLISRMLTKDPKQRITLKEIQNHPWLKRCDRSSDTKSGSYSTDYYPHSKDSSDSSDCEDEPYYYHDTDGGYYYGNSSYYGQ